MIFTQLGREGLLEGLSVLRSMEREFARKIGDKKMAGLRAALLAILAER